MRCTHLLASTGIEGHYDLIHKRDVKLPGEVENALRKTLATMSSACLAASRTVRTSMMAATRDFATRLLLVWSWRTLRWLLREIEPGWAEGQIRPDLPYINAHS